MPILINGQKPLSDGPGVQFDLDKLSPRMLYLFKRLVPRIIGPVKGLIVPDQNYIDLHWPWKGYIRVGSPIVNYAGREKHVALALWSLWQAYPTVADGPVKRLCLFTGCVNPHHYQYPKGYAQPAPMTFTLEGDPGEMAAARLITQYQYAAGLQVQRAEEPSEEE